MPNLWSDYVVCSSVLDLPATPDLYVTNDPVVNAMTIGAKTPIVIVRSSLVGSYEGHETQTVLGHELGHVLSEHYYYTTALVLLKQFIDGALPRSLLWASRPEACIWPFWSGPMPPNFLPTGLLRW